MSKLQALLDLLAVHETLLQALRDTPSYLAMAVVTKYGSGAKDPTSLKNVENIYNSGRMRCLKSSVTITNGDSAASLYYFGDIPSNALIHGDLAFLDNAAITSSTSFHLGFYSPAGGAVISNNALINARDISSAANANLRTIGTLTLANSNKRAWELAGLSADPGGVLSVVGTLNVAATATGVVELTLPHSVN